MLTPSQLTALKADIAADPVLNAFPNNSDGAFAIADAYNLKAAPDFWVWRTSVFESEYTRQSAIDTDGITVTNWSWTTYIGRSQGERDAWPRLFMGGGAGANPSLPNVRQGVADIFSGAPAAPQRAHLTAVSRRLATRVEKVLVNVGAGGSGTAASPATMGFEGALSYHDVETARSL